MQLCVKHERSANGNMNIWNIFTYIRTCTTNSTMTIGQQHHIVISNTHHVPSWTLHYILSVDS